MAFNIYDINPNDLISEPDAASAPQKELDFVAADQRNFAENPPPAEPRGKFAQRATEAAAVLGGAGTGAALKYRQGMFSPDPSAKFTTSSAGFGAGEPLSQFELSLPTGQNVESARRNLQTEIAKWQAAGGMRDVEADKLRGAYERSVVETPQAVAAREAALNRLVETGGLKPPPQMPSVSVTPTGTGSDVINRIQSAETAPDRPVSSLSRAFGQHEYEAQAKMLRDKGIKTIEDLRRLGAVDMDVANYISRHGMFLPTQEGRVLVRPETLLTRQEVNLSPEEIAARQAQEQADEIARARMRAEMRAQGREYEVARSGYGAATSEAKAAQKAEKSALDKYLNFMGQRGLESEKLAPNVEIAQNALINARAQMPSTFSKVMTGAKRALPVMGGVVAGAGAGEFGTEAYERTQRDDPIGAALSSIGATSSAASMYPPLAIPGAIGALSSAGALALYDKYGPEILPFLEQKGLIPPNWNPANHSVMKGYR